MNTHEFDDIIKQKAQQREADIPEDLWDGIAEERKRRRFLVFWLTLIVLILGAGVVIWGMNTKEKPVELAGKEKSTGKNNSANINKMDKDANINSVTPLVNNVDKNDNVVETAVKKKLTGENNTAGKNEYSKMINNKIIPASSNNVDRKNNQQATNSTKAIGKMIDVNGSQASTISNEHDIVSTKPAHHDRKTTDLIGDVAKKGQVNDPGVYITPGATALLSSKKKHNTKGKMKLNITAGESDSSAATVINKEELFSASNNQQDHKGIQKIYIADEEINKAANDKTKNDDNKIVEYKKEQFSLTAIGDSLPAEKIAALIDDSIDNKKPTAFRNLKTSNKQSKKTGLIIEAGLTAVFPLQNYQQPLYVKRIIDRTNIYSEFISDNIKTTVETGAGFNVSLVKSLNKKWSIGAGIGYLRFTEHLEMSGVETHTNYTIIQRVVNTPGGGSFLKNDTVSALTKDKTTLNGRNIYNSFSMPVFIRYQVTNRKKWSAAVTAGVYVDLLRKYHNSTPGKFETVYTYGTESAESKNTIGIDLFAGLHVERRLSKKYALFTTPGFRYNLSAYKTNNLSFNKKIHKPTVSIGISRYL